MQERVLLLLNNNLEALGVSQLCETINWDIQGTYLISDIVHSSIYDEFVDHSIVIISVGPRDISFLNDSFLKNYQRDGRVIILLRGDVAQTAIDPLVHRFAGVIRSDAGASEIKRVMGLIADGYHITSFQTAHQDIMPPAAVAGPIMSKLSARELEIGNHLTEGASNKEIALQLDISANTVNAHLAAIRRKLSCRNRTEVALFFHKHTNTTDKSG